MIGTYTFTAPDLGPAGVRELRDPDADDQDDCPARSAGGTIGALRLLRAQQWLGAATERVPERPGDREVDVALAENYVCAGGRRRGVLRCCA